MEETLYNLKIIDSGKRKEVYKYQAYIRLNKDSTNKQGRKGKDYLTEEEKKKNSDISRKMVLYKARNNIIRLIAANNDLLTFITLTYKENMQDMEQSKKDLMLFFKKLKREYKELKYIWILEFQERGAIHYHILTNWKVTFKCDPKEKLKSEGQKKYEKKFSSAYWKYGFVDIRPLNDIGITNVSKYVASYLVEDIINLNLNGYRVYGYSRNLNKPIVTKLDTSDTIEDLSTIQGYKTQYINSYDIKYVDNKGINRGFKVVYYDYIKGD